MITASITKGISTSELLAKITSRKTRKEDNITGSTSSITTQPEVRGGSSEEETAEEAGALVVEADSEGVVEDSGEEERASEEAALVETHSSKAEVASIKIDDSETGRMANNNSIAQRTC
jgi:hypothetical protein